MQEAGRGPAGNKQKGAIRALDKGKPFERAGRKAKGHPGRMSAARNARRAFAPRGHGSQLPKTVYQLTPSPSTPYRRGTV